ncbi:MAG: hypothetical protein QM813_04630 [Verrucomicrobiota bacterium]
MKTTILLVLGLGLGIAGTIVYFKQRPASPPTPAVAPTAEVAPVTPAEIVSVASKSVPVVVETKPASAPPTNAVVPEVESEAAAALRKTVDALLAPQFAGQKHQLFDQLRTSGQLDQVIAELKRRATDDPNNAAIPTTLGEAMLNKVRQLHEAGADVNEVGILAMQADQSFNAALKLDPQNWEAQFVKYSTMVYWPAEPTRDNEAAQKLSSLIDQQEALPQQSHFVQTYVALGNQYQKMGKQDFAEATWRLGLTKFPNDPTLLKKVAALK